MRESESLAEILTTVLDRQAEQIQMQIEQTQNLTKVVTYLISLIEDMYDDDQEPHIPESL